MTTPIPRRSKALRLAVRGIAVATTILGLTACSSGGGGSLSGGGSGDGGGSATLVVPTSQAPWNPAYAKLVQEYQKETGNKVDLRPFPNPDVKTQELNDVQSQKHTFDIYQINEQDLPQFNDNKWIENFTNIDPNYKADDAIFGYSNVANWDAKTKTFSSDGEVTNQPILGNLDLFVYRKDIYKDLGLSVPKTWDEVVSNGEKIESANAAKYGGVFRTQGVPGTYGATFEFQALLNGAGASWFKDAGTNWTPTADSEQSVTAATWLRKLAQLGPDATTTLGQAQVIAEIQNGDAAQSYLVAASAAQLEDPANSSVAGKIGYAPLPETPSGKASSATGLWSLAIPKGLPADRAKAALDYITWMTSEKAQTLFAQYGGIPVRDDAYRPSGISDPQQKALNAVKATAEKLPEAPTSLRFSFSGDILNVTESALQDIAAGTISPEEGMRKIHTQLSDVVTKQNLPQG